LAFGLLVAVSVPPLTFFGLKLIEINRQTLETNEQELQNTLARTIAHQISLYDSNARQLLRTFARTLEGVDLSATKIDSPVVRDKLEQFVAGDSNLLYVTLLNDQGKGIRAGSYNAEADPFVLKVLERGFVAVQQDQSYFSTPVLVSRGGRTTPIAVLAQPVKNSASTTGKGMLAVVMDLSDLRNQLTTASKRGLETYVVDRNGKLMLHPAQDGDPIGTDLRDRGIVRKFMGWSGQALATETSSFDMLVKGQRIPMLGTYCAIPSLQWAVIAQKRQSDAYVSVTEMQQTTMVWGGVWILACLVMAYFAASRVSNPIVRLTESSRAIAKGDFSRRIHLKSRTEIGELAESFNTMTAELEQYVERLKQAAQENHDLFIASVRMIAAAVDEKDPYTHGHAERVTRYSVLIATELGLPEEDVYKIRISALLHDVGKIGIEDKILKKPGALTPDEYVIMKTHPVKGANIVRAVPQLHDMLPGIELHLEFVDGTGYPHHLKADNIPQMARIIAVADTFDAMTTHRPYQSAMDPSVAIRFLGEQAGRRYDPDCVAALQRINDSGKLKLQRVAAVL
jgi:HD-GYP domain-containing protein (c-di-GMP phosphodiesterase class II)